VDVEFLRAKTDVNFSEQIDSAQRVDVAEWLWAIVSDLSEGAL
jgi:hypothetical protein